MIMHLVDQEMMLGSLKLKKIDYQSKMDLAPHLGEKQGCPGKEHLVLATWDNQRRLQCEQIGTMCRGVSDIGDS